MCPPRALPISRFSSTPLQAQSPAIEGVLPPCTIRSRRFLAPALAPSCRTASNSRCHRPSRPLLLNSSSLPASPLAIVECALAMLVAAPRRSSLPCTLPREFPRCLPAPPRTQSPRHSHPNTDKSSSSFRPPSQTPRKIRCQPRSSSHLPAQLTSNSTTTSPNSCSTHT